MIEVRALSKTFGDRYAVNELSFTAPSGSVTGFLGPNGSGKTTTFRCLLGLAEPSSGTALIDGRAYRDLDSPRHHVGALLESTGFHPARTGRNHLRVIARAARIDAARIDPLLEMAGLRAAADRRVGGYSLGMRQRLGLAAAMLGDPELVILDEPANGLDPEGIAWMRSLLRDFADRGGTVLLSSHLLHEVQATVDHLAVISHGVVVAAGPLSELLASSSLFLRTPDPDALAGALRSARIGYVPGPDQTFTVDVLDGRVTAELVARAALDRRVLLTELRQSDSGGLEQLFFSLTATETVPTQEAAA